MRPSGSNYPALRAGALIPLALATGAALGGLGVVVDEAELPGGRFIFVLVSSGFSWGTGATVAGILARDVRAAAIGGCTLLLAAVWTYYGANHLLGLRETAGASSIAAAAVTWGSIGVVGGALLGVLGWLARSGAERWRALARGGLCGLLLGQGAAWAIEYGLAPDPVFTPALVGPLVLFWFASRGVPAAPAVAGLAVAGIISAVGWSVIRVAT